MDTNKIIIDVREPFEYDAGHVQDALNIPPSELMAGSDQLKEVPKDTKLVVYCRSGSRSNSSIQILKQMGFTNLVNGINAGHVAKNHTNNNTYDNVDDYIDKSPVGVQDILRQIRTVIKNVAPSAVEGISYGMPAYKHDGKPLVYFAGFQNHIGFYATPQSHEKFSVELAKYKQGKGSVQFPLSQPIPYELIEKMASYKLK